MSQKTSNRQEAGHDLKKHLSGGALKNALDFDAFMRASDMLPEKGWQDAYNYKYQNDLVCILAFPPFWDVTSWNIYFFPQISIYDGDWGDIPADENLKEFVWAHVNKCKVAIGENCGCEYQPGKQIRVFGKQFDSTCMHILKFENPDADAVGNICKYVRLMRLCIDAAPKKEEK